METAILETQAPAKKPAPDSKTFAVVFFGEDDACIGCASVSLQLKADPFEALRAAVFKKWPDGAVVAQVMSKRDTFAHEYRRRP